MGWFSVEAPPMVLGTFHITLVAWFTNFPARDNSEMLGNTLIDFVASLVLETAAIHYRNCTTEKLILNTLSRVLGIVCYNQVR